MSRTRTKLGIAVAAALAASTVAIGAVGPGGAAAATSAAHADAWSSPNPVLWFPVPPAGTEPLGPPNSTCVGTNSSPGGAEAFFTFPAFAIPGGDTIDGIEVKPKYRTNDDHRIRLHDGGTLIGSEKVLPLDFSGMSNCDSTSVNTIGGPSDLWGTGGSLTPADFNAGNIGVWIKLSTCTCPDAGNSIPLDLDSVEMIVHHSPANSAPTADAGGPYNVPEGGSVLLSGSGSSDPDGDPLTYEWDLDDDGLYDDANGVNPSFSAAGRDGPDSQTVGLRVSDGIETDTDTATVNITNVAPTLSGLAATSLDEDGTTTFTGNIADPGTPDTFTLTVDWGDPLSPGNVEVVNLPAGTTNFALVHQYLDDNPSGTPSDTYTIAVDLEDDDGGSDSDSTTVDVSNVDPVADAGADQVIEWVDGESVDVDASGSSDVGTLDTLTYAWSFVSTPAGSSAAFVDPSAAATSFLPDELGTYTAQVTVTDDDTGSDTDTVVIVVEDTIAPEVTAALVPISGGGDDDDDDDERNYRVEFSCTDACDQDPKVKARLNGIKVQDGQIVSLEFDDDYEVEWDDGILEFEAPKFKLKVRCKDSAGNVGKAKVVLKPPPDDDDDDGDDDD